MKTSNKLFFATTVFLAILLWFVSLIGVIYLLIIKTRTISTLILFILMLSYVVWFNMNDRWFPIGLYIAIKEAWQEQEPPYKRWIN